MNQLTNKFQISTKTKRIIILTAMLTVVCSIFTVTAFAATTNTDVGGNLQSAFQTYLQPQIIKIVNGVVLPIIDVVLAVYFLVKIVMAGVNYKKNPGGEFEWHVPAILFAGLVIALTASLWMWGIIGWK
jgi:hypothetical protein